MGVGTGGRNGLRVTHAVFLLSLKTPSLGHPLNTQRPPPKLSVWTVSGTAGREGENTSVKSTSHRDTVATRTTPLAPGTKTGKGAEITESRSRQT